jgi:purine-nucleoside phosphorylase
MSTVPEAIVARQCGLSIAGLSCITNMAGGDTKTGVLVHQDVLNMGESKRKEMAVFLKAFTQLYGRKK